MNDDSIAEKEEGPIMLTPSRGGDPPALPQPSSARRRRALRVIAGFAVPLAAVVTTLAPSVAINITSIQVNECVNEAQLTDSHVCQRARR